MIKKTLYFGNPAYLSLKDQQLVIKLQSKIGAEASASQENIITKPIEDIGVVVLDNSQITITHGALSALLDNQVAVITCNKQGLPTGLMLPLDGNKTQSEKFRHQINASLPLKKRLWQQTVKAKISNQIAVLNSCAKCETRCLKIWCDNVKAGDPDNQEARSAAYYWRNLFQNITDFTRDRYGMPPNNLLNYGYSILRGVVARALVGSGMLPTFGIHHHNKYNAYCLADDIMEPYRPYVDELVYRIIEIKGTPPDDLDKEWKTSMLTIPTLDVVIDGKRMPLMIGVTMTTASLYKCFSGELKQISYPEK